MADDDRHADAEARTAWWRRHGRSIERALYAFREHGDDTPLAELPADARAVVLRELGYPTTASDTPTLPFTL